MAFSGFPIGSFVSVKCDDSAIHEIPVLSIFFAVYSLFTIDLII